MFRRILFTVSAFTPGYPALKIHLFIACTVFYLVYLLHFKPFLRSVIFKMEIFNEIISIIFSYFLFPFITDLSIKPST